MSKCEHCKVWYYDEAVHHERCPMYNDPDPEELTAKDCVRIIVLSKRRIRLLENEVSTLHRYVDEIMGQIRELQPEKA